MPVAAIRGLNARCAAPPPPGPLPRTGAPRSSRRRCPSSRGSAAAVSGPASGPAMPGDAPPVHRGNSLTSADTYFPACSHGSVRAKHGRCSHSSSFRFRSASPAPILTAAAASDFVLVTQACSRGGCDHTSPSGNKGTSTTPGPFAQLTAPSAAALPVTPSCVAGAGQTACRGSSSRS
jgi:hypothetical protein